MIKREDEDKAFARLVKVLPGQYCSLQLDRTSTRDGKGESKYQAYTSMHSLLSEHFNTPGEAVDNLIEKIVIREAERINDLK